MIPKKTVKTPLTSIGQTKCLYNIITTTTALIFYLTTEINCCVVTPREFLTTVGEVVSLRCNARPNNEQRGTVSNLKLENEGKSETLIFQAPVYNAKGGISTENFVANGYFLSKFDENLVDATIQINETQLKHGGRYVCSCTGATLSTGSANLVVLADKLSFALNGGNSPTPGEPLDLNCSMAFSGSLSPVSVDLTINDENGTKLEAKEILSLTSSQGSLYVNYSFIAKRNKEQNFTCEMKVWNQSSSEKPLLRSMTSHYSLNSDSQTGVTQVTVGLTAGGVAGIIVGLLVLIALLVAIAILFYRRRSKRDTRESNSCDLVAQKNSATPLSSRYEGPRPSIEHRTEDRKQENKTRTGNEVIVVDNDIYDASPRKTVSTGFLSLPKTLGNEAFSSSVCPWPYNASTQYLFKGLFP